MSDDVAAINDALARARRQVGVLEIEKPHALKRFIEQDMKMKRIEAENKELRAKLKERA